MEEGEVYGIIVIPADYTRSLQLGQQAEVLVGINSANNLVGNSAVVSVMQVVKTVSSRLRSKAMWHRAAPLRRVRRRLCRFRLCFARGLIPSSVI